MHTRRHPDFKRSCNAFCLRGLAVLGLAATFYVSSFFPGADAYDVTLTLVFFVTVLSVVVLGFARLYRARCPDCRCRTRVYRDNRAMDWTAECGRCQVKWKLGIDTF